MLVDDPYTHKKIVQGLSWLQVPLFSIHGQRHIAVSVDASGQQGRVRCRVGDELDRVLSWFSCPSSIRLKLQKIDHGVKQIQNSNLTSKIDCWPCDFLPRSDQVDPSPINQIYSSRVSVRDCSRSADSAAWGRSTTGSMQRTAVRNGT